MMKTFTDKEIEELRGQEKLEFQQKERKLSPDYPESEEEWKENHKAKAMPVRIKPMEFELICNLDEGLVKQWIKNCEGEHIQQVAYSSYHDALTQICFGCKKIRTSLKKGDLK